MKRIQLRLADQLLPFQARIAYVMDCFCNHPLAAKQLSYQINGPADSQAINILYAPEKPAALTAFFIPAQGIAFAKHPPRFSDLKANGFDHADLTLYSVAYQKQANQAFCSNGIFAFDWLETLFFHLSRYEEYHCRSHQMDPWDMMKKEEQFLYKHHLHLQPIVDHLVFACLSVLGLTPKRIATTYCMTHDIDAVWKFPSLWKYIRAAGRQYFKDRQISSQFTLLKTYWQTRQGQQKDPYDTFDWLLRKEPRFEKIIYWLAGGITRYDHFFDIRHPYVASLLRLARQRGYQIGLHPSYAAYQREDLLLKEKTDLEAVAQQRIFHNRQHFLHVDWPLTWSLLEAAGITEDSSLGYQDTLGFRCGTGFPYPLYHFEKEAPFDFVERPLVIMDTAVLMNCHDQADQAIAQIKQLLNKNPSLTHITFNFHNSTFDPLRLDAAVFKDFYEELCHWLNLPAEQGDAKSFL